MEYRTEFNLEKSIDQWRSTLITTANFTEDNIAELESHLLDEIQDLGLLGLSESESFLVAKKRLGRTDEISNEFGKVNKLTITKNKALPVLNGVLVFVAFILITSCCIYATFFAGVYAGVIVSENIISMTTILSLLMFGLGLMSIVFLKYWKSNRFLCVFHNIPLLVCLTSAFLFINLLLEYLLNKFVFGSPGEIVFMVFDIPMNLSVFLILIVSTIIYYSSKTKNKVVLAK